MMGNFDWMHDEAVVSRLGKNQRKLLEIIGVQAFVALCETFAGKELRITSSPIRKARRLYVAKHFDGSNAKELARKIGVTSRTVYNYVREHRESVKASRRNKDL